LDLQSSARTTFQKVYDSISTSLAGLSPGIDPEYFIQALHKATSTVVIPLIHPGVGDQHPDGPETLY
jgi:hypothetical protein